MVAACYALERAYEQWYRDLVFYDGSGAVAMQLINRGSLTGVKIVGPPSYPEGTGAQFSTYRDYTITATADYPVAGQNPVKSFQETLSFSGGGPRRAVVECVNVPPQEQVLTAYTAYRARQTGSAVGMYAYPPVPAPLFPAKLEFAAEPSFGSPKLRNGVYTEFPVSWSYTFVSGTPLSGRPNRWPSGG